MSTVKKAKKQQAPGKEIGIFIHHCREAKGMSQREFAEAIGTNGPNVNNVEHGKWRYPVEFIKKLSKQERQVALEILIKYLKQDFGL